MVFAKTIIIKAAVKLPDQVLVATHEAPPVRPLSKWWAAFKAGKAHLPRDPAQRSESAVLPEE